jgi:Na+-transporting NADH:ubiquinone oxidoreductase subunit NqrC
MIDNEQILSDEAYARQLQQQELGGIYENQISQPLLDAQQNQYRNQNARGTRRFLIGFNCHTEKFLMVFCVT